MSNITEIFTPILQIITKSYPYLGPLLISLVSFFIGWGVNNRVADRDFLRTDIYVPLYEEIIFMKENISNYENCFYISPAKPNEEKFGKVRGTLQRTGQYKLIPNKLRNNIDQYYQKCEEYNKSLRRAKDEIANINIKEIRKIKTEEDHKQFLKKVAKNGIGIAGAPKLLLRGEYVEGDWDLREDQGYTLIDSQKWDGVITNDDLTRNSMSCKNFIDRLIELVGQNESVINYRNLQNELKNPEDLLRKIEKKIKNPNPLFETYKK